MSAGTLVLGFGQDNPQYHLFPYPAPADDETIGVFFDWHTADFFDVDTGPHVAVGLRGPVDEDPHRGRGLAIGILSNGTSHSEKPGEIVPLFPGCPDPPGGPSFFIEDFTVNDGTAPPSDWQLSLGQHLPLLQGEGLYRVDIHVSFGNVWVGVWKVTANRSAGGEIAREYRFLGQATCTDEAPGYRGTPDLPCPEDPGDRGKGNVFIGTGFASPETRSRIENIYIAHWKSQRGHGDG